MKKPNKNTSLSKEKSKKEEEPQTKLTLVVDSNDTYQEDLTVFYIHPKRLLLAQHLTDKIFDGAFIKNTGVDFITSMNLNYIMKKLKVNAPIEIIVSQPLSVMQPYDAKQIEANAKLAGLDQFKSSNTEIELNGVKFTTLKIEAIRPERNPNLVQVEVEITRKEAKSKVKN